jgi:DNA-binding CsgD family transcriptional regulator
MARDGTVTERDSVSSDITCLRALVRSLDDGADGDDDGSEQVLMDVDLDGQRYLLIRMPTVGRKVASLSPREIEIVRLVAEGHPNKVIAAVLEISSWTVCTHVRRVFAKLGVSSRAAMVARLVEFGGITEGILMSSPLRTRPSEEHVHTKFDWRSSGPSLTPTRRAASVDAPIAAHTRMNDRIDRRRLKVALAGTVSDH